MNKTILASLFVFMFMLSFAVAQPPFQQSSLDTGITIETSVTMSHPINEDYFFNIHAQNSSNGLLLTNETTNCTIHIFRPSDGDHILEEQMPFDTNGIDFDRVVEGGNFTEIGQYWVLFNCEVEGDIGGFIAYGFDVTYTGQNEPLALGGSFLLLTFFALFLVGFIHLKMKIDFKRWYEGILRKNHDGKKNLVMVVLSALAYTILSHPMILYYLIGFVVMLLVMNIVLTYNMVSIFGIMESLMFLYSWSAVLVGLSFLGYLQQIIVKIFDDVSSMDWGIPLDGK